MKHAMSPHDERKVAVAAGCDPRSVRHFLAGRPQHSTTSSRIRSALIDFGMGHLLGTPRDKKVGAVRS